jgi:hypothetical protein
MYFLTNICFPSHSVSSASKILVTRFFCISRIVCWLFVSTNELLFIHSLSAIGTKNRQQPASSSALERADNSVHAPPQAYICSSPGKELQLTARLKQTELWRTS